MALSEKVGRWLLRILFRRYSGIESWNMDPLRVAVNFASQPVDERMAGRTFMGPGATGYANKALAKIWELL